MKRRTLLKRVGATGLGIATITTGSASASTSSERRRVQIDGQTYVTFSDVNVAAVDPEDACECEECHPRYCTICEIC